MGVARGREIVKVPPDRAVALWTNVRRWPSFVEGFARVERTKDDWPEKGAQITWQSIPGGRGTVTERVVERGEANIVTEVFEDALEGRQTVTFEPLDNGRTDVRLELDYKLTKAGVLRQVTDVLFIRRALQDAMGRTLRRFAREAEEEAAL